MAAPLNTAKLGLLLPAVLNPVTAAAVGIGLGLLWLMRDGEEEGVVTVEAKTVKQAKPAARTVVKPLPAVEAFTDKSVPVIIEAVPASISETD